MIDFVWKNKTLKWRIDNPWSDVMTCSGPRLSNSRSSLLGVAGAGTLKLKFVAKMWRNWNFLKKKNSSMHSRDTKTGKITFWLSKHFKFVTQPNLVPLPEPEIACNFNLFVPNLPRLQWLSVLKKIIRRLSINHVDLYFLSLVSVSLNNWYIFQNGSANVVMALTFLLGVRNCLWR